VVHLKEFRPTNEEIIFIWGLRRRDQVKERIMSRKESCPELVIRRNVVIEE